MGNNRKGAAAVPDPDAPVADGFAAMTGIPVPAEEAPADAAEDPGGQAEAVDAVPRVETPDRIDPVPDIEFLDLSKMYGTVRDAMLDRVKASPRPWHQLTAREQRELSEGIGLVASKLIRGVVEKLQDYSYARVVVQVGDVKISAKGTVEAKIVCNAVPENLAVMADAVGAWATLLMVNSDAFMGEARPVRIDEDQPGLPLDEDASPVPDVPAAEASDGESPAEALGGGPEPDPNAAADDSADCQAVA